MVQSKWSITSLMLLVLFQSACGLCTSRILRPALDWGVFLLTLTLCLMSAGKMEAQQTVPVDIIPEHGKYSAAYMSDWATLPTGDIRARKNLSEVTFTPVVGEEVRREWLHQDIVHLKDLYLSVHWNRDEADKDETTLFRIVDAKEVVIENLWIINSDPDYRAYHDILVEGADRVIVRNLYLAGTVNSCHLRLEGCRDIFIDNVEIAGVDYEGHGRTRTGGGIWINNGLTGKAGINGTGLWTEYARKPGWQIVQNCYFHGGIESDGGKWRNQDALLIHTPGDGLVFNCVVENWFHPVMDGGFDISFRRMEPEYQNRFFRIERNILRNTPLGVKTPAQSLGPSVLFYANNLFINSQLADYHKHADNDVYYVHNTYIYDLDKAPPDLRKDAKRGASGYANLWNYGAATVLNNSLLYKSGENSFTFYDANSMNTPDKYLHFKPDYNIYAIRPDRAVWLRTAADGVKFRSLDQWRAGTSTDEHSLLVEPESVPFANYQGNDYRLFSNPWEGVVTESYLDPEDTRMTVNRDFYGHLRSASPAPSPGAFEPISNSTY